MQDSDRTAGTDMSPLTKHRHLLALGCASLLSLFAGESCGYQSGYSPSGAGGSVGLDASPSGGALGVSCPLGQSVCSGACLDTTSDVLNCGTCGSACVSGQSCAAGVCECQAGLSACQAGCVDTLSDGLNCGACETACAAGLVCSLGACADTCAFGLSKCGTSCVDINTNVLNCGVCDNACGAGRACTDATCTCDAGQAECSGTCVDVFSNASHCGSCGTLCAAGESCNQGVCQCPVGQTCGVVSNTGGSGNTGGSSNLNTGGGANTGGASNTGGVSNTGGGDDGSGGGSDEVKEIVVEGRVCPAYEGLIADFEEAENATATLQAEGRIGLIVANNDDSATQTLTIETEGSEDCNNKVLHTTGSGFSTWGAGLETVFTGTWDEAEAGYVADPYDATALGYVGVTFRAKAGPGQSNPVRFSLSTPGTRKPANEADEGKNGNCIDEDPDNACWNHLGQFLIDNEELTTDWKEYTFCFDRDLHARFMPMHLSPSQRGSVGTELMTVGFEFNKGTEDNGDENDIGQSFDFYLDDLRLVKSGCDRTIFQSSAGTTQPFGSNLAVGSCQPVPNAAIYNAQIGDAYVRWRDSFVTSQGTVVDTENNNKVISEGIGYGMLLSAAMGDRDTFDRIWGWASSKLSNGLLGWDNGDGGSGSATDADTDIAYALYMAAYQWGGDYASAASSMASAAASADLSGTTIKGGSQFDANNPSYFSPGFYRKLGGSWNSAISAGYSWLNSCDAKFGGGENGLISDWCNYSGDAQTPAGQVTSETCGSGEICSAYDASRIPWRVGYDVCFDGAGSALASRIVTMYNSYYSGRIDLLEAGWTSSGSPTSGAVPNEMAFLGTVGVAAWATDNANNRERAFHAALDLLELREYYKKYYSTSLGLLTLTLMTGNWPVP